MDALDQIRKHEKAITIINHIQECDRLISISNRRLKEKTFIFLGMKNYELERIEINTAIKNKLTRYYENNFKL